MSAQRLRQTADCRSWEARRSPRSPAPVRSGRGQLEHEHDASNSVDDTGKRHGERMRSQREKGEGDRGEAGDGEEDGGEGYGGEMERARERNEPTSEKECVRE